jgi:hypothetical protein
MNNTKPKTLTARFLDTKPRVLLELSNDSNETHKAVEILAIFLKADASTVVLPEAQIKFDVVKVMPAQHGAVVSHRTWIDGKPVNDERDQMGRLKLVAGEPSPYVLHISWEDAEGKARFQSIPVGH